MQPLALAAAALTAWAVLRPAGGGAAAATGAPDRASRFDTTHGVDTDGEIPLDRFGDVPAIAAHGERYQPIEEAALVDAVAWIGIDPRRFTFIDLGCGKGRALIIAARLGFRRIIGVELIGELAATARRNLARLGIDTAVVETQDAGEFQFPAEPVVLFLYNPFKISVVVRVIDNLRAAQNPELFVVYKAPECAAAFDASGFLTSLGAPPRWDARNGIRIWRAGAGTSSARPRGADPRQDELVQRAPIS
jgi:SAM-dependent methyltransferase